MRGSGLEPNADEEGDGADARRYGCGMGIDAICVFRGISCLICVRPFLLFSLATNLARFGTRGLGLEALVAWVYSFLEARSMSMVLTVPSLCAMQEAGV